MNKFSLLLPIVLFACGSEAADGPGIPGANQTAAVPGPGATDAVGTGTPVSAPVATDQGSSHDHDIAVTDGTNAFPTGRGFPSIDPAPSSPAANPTPSTEPSATTTDPATTDAGTPSTRSRDDGRRHPFDGSRDDGRRHPFDRPVRPDVQREPAQREVEGHGLGDRLG